jgi:hypothetical protein
LTKDIGCSIVGEVNLYFCPKGGEKKVKTLTRREFLITLAGGGLALAGMSGSPSAEASTVEDGSLIIKDARGTYRYRLQTVLREPVLISDKALGVAGRNETTGGETFASWDMRGTAIYQARQPLTDRSEIYRRFRVGRPNLHGLTEVDQASILTQWKGQELLVEEVQWNTPDWTKIPKLIPANGGKLRVESCFILHPRPTKSGGRE